MFTMVANSTRMAVSAVAAVAIVSFSGLVLDQAHIAAAPQGRVEIGELTPVGTMQMASTTLPEITVVGKRDADAPALLAGAELPEIVVSAKRVAYVVAKGQSAVKGSADGALLK